MKSPLILCCVILFFSVFASSVPVNANLHLSSVNAESPSTPIQTVETVDSSPTYPYELFWREIYVGFSQWDLEYYNGSDWILRNDLLNVSNSPVGSRCKTFLSIWFDEAGAYRITFYINLEVQNYTYQENSYNLTYEDHDLFYDWNDIVNLELVGIVFTHGVDDGRFYFRFQKDDCPSNVGIVTDPITVTDTDKNYAMRYMNQRKVFQNPRGLKWYYIFLYYHNTTWTTYETRIYRSEDGSVWNSGDYQTIKVYTSSSYKSSCLWVNNNGSDLIIYMSYDIGNNLYYRRAVLNDASSAITLEAEQTIFTGNILLKPYTPVITLAEDGYVWVSYFLWNSTAITKLWVDGFTSTYLDWTEVGSSPYLDAVDDPTNIVHTSGSGDVEGNWTYTDSTIDPATVKLWFYSNGDTNDWFDVFLYNGVGWTDVGDIIPDITYSWKSRTVSAQLSSINRLNQAKVYVVKRNTGKGNTIEIDASYIEVLTPYDVHVSISDVTYNPTVSDWTDHRVKEAGAILGATTMCPLSADHDVILLWKYQENTTNWRRAGAELSWNGATLTTGVLETGDLSSDNPTESTLISVVDSDNLVHLLHSHLGNQRMTYWVIGEGYNESIGTTIFSAQLHASLSINLSATPNEMYFFSTTTVGVSPNVNVTIEVYLIELDHTATHLATVNDQENQVTGYNLVHLSATYRDCEGTVALAYGRVSANDVRFYEYPPSLPEDEPSISWNCFYIDVNNTVYGYPTRFWSDWGDLNATEGLSFYLFSWNESGSQVNMSWSNDWINENETYYDISDLNVSIGTRLGFQWYANDTSGVEYESAVFSFIVEAPFDFNSVFYLIGMTTLLPAILAVWLIKKRREDNSDASRL